MRRFKRWGRRTAYYGANHGNEYSKSARASDAESAGRLPITRAAKSLGLSVDAFRAGCRAIGYHSTEWHHVGKYATMVDYWDTVFVRAFPAFWEGAATAYKSNAKRSLLDSFGEEIRHNQYRDAIRQHQTVSI